MTGDYLDDEIAAYIADMQAKADLQVRAGQLATLVTLDWNNKIRAVLLEINQKLSKVGVNVQAPQHSTTNNGRVGILHIYANQRDHGQRRCPPLVLTSDEKTLLVTLSVEGVQATRTIEPGLITDDKLRVMVINYALTSLRLINDIPFQSGRGDETPDLQGTE